MTANYEEHGFEVIAKKLPEACACCPFWVVNTETIEDGECYITGHAISIDGPQDEERMNDFPIRLEENGDGIEKYRELERKLNGVNLTMLVNHFMEMAAEGEIQGYHRGRVLTNEDADKWDAYLTIGTPDEFRKCMDIVSKSELNELSKIIDEWILYHKLGSPEECREAIEECKDIRNKAIDDFKKEVKNLIVDLNVIRFKDIDEIAERLKAGDGE